MPQFSALFASVLLVVSFLRLYLAHLGGADVHEQSYALLISGYMILLAISGWFYTLFKIRLWGIAHVLLMLCAGAFICFGNFLGKLHETGGSGPGANPAAPMIQLVSLAVGAVGILALVCGVGVGRHLFTSNKSRVNNFESHSDE